MPENALANVIGYERGLALVGKKTRRKIANHTFLWKCGNGNLVIRHHETDIITIRPDDTWVLDRGGFPTPTTTARFNKFTPATVKTKASVQYLIPVGGPEIKFFDRIVVDKQGNLVPPALC